MPGKGSDVALPQPALELAWAFPGVALSQQVQDVPAGLAAEQLNSRGTSFAEIDSNHSYSPAELTGPVPGQSWPSTCGTRGRSGRPTVPAVPALALVPQSDLVRVGHGQ